MPLSSTCLYSSWLLPPLTLGQELIAAQVIPSIEHLWKAGGFEEAPICFDNVSFTALRRMAGNSFNQSCATTFVMFVLSQLVPVKWWIQIPITQSCWSVSVPCLMVKFWIYKNWLESELASESRWKEFESLSSLSFHSLWLSAYQPVVTFLVVVSIIYIYILNTCRQTVLHMLHVCTATRMVKVSHVQHCMGSIKSMQIDCQTAMAR